MSGIRDIFKLIDRGIQFNLMVYDENAEASQCTNRLLMRGVEIFHNNFGHIPTSLIIDEYDFEALTINIITDIYKYNIIDLKSNFPKVFGMDVLFTKYLSSIRDYDLPKNMRGIPIYMDHFEQQGATLCSGDTGLVLFTDGDNVLLGSR